MSAQLLYKFGATVVSTEAIMSSSNTTTSSSSSSMSLSGKGPLLRLAVCGEEMRLSREASKNSLSLASEVGGAGSCNLARNKVEGARVKDKECSGFGIEIMVRKCKDYYQAHTWTTRYSEALTYHFR